jgi:hypothetical protein
MADQDLSLGVLQIFNSDIDELNNIFARIQALIDNLTRITLSIVSDIPANQVTHVIGGTPAETGGFISLYSPNHPTFADFIQYRAIQHIFLSHDALMDYITMAAGLTIMHGSAVIGGPLLSPPDTTNLALEVIGKFLLVPVLTTAERDALAPYNGVFFYNSTLNKYQGREAGVYKTFTTT